MTSMITFQCRVFTEITKMSVDDQMSKTPTKRGILPRSANGYTDSSVRRMVGYCVVCRSVSRGPGIASVNILPSGRGIPTTHQGRV